MNDSNRPIPPISPDALLRYSVLAKVESLVLAGSSPSDAVREVAGQQHAYLDGRLVLVSVRTLQRWRAAYAKDGIEGLVPKSRKRTETSVVLSDALVAFLRTEKQLDPRASVPELLRRAETLGIIAADLHIDRTTAWRACRRMGLPTRSGPSKHEGDMRRWRYPHRMQCVLADGKHIRVGEARLRRVVLFFLDDATRYGLYALVGTSESTELFLHGLYGMVTMHGLPDLMYLDRGPGFISNDTFAGDTPRQRWEAGRPLRFPEDQTDLYRRFVVHEPKKVSTDHVIKAGGQLWEAPRGMGDTWVQVARHVLDGWFWVLHEGRMVLLTELDPHANATERRNYNKDDQPTSSEGTPITAARIAFDHDLRPLVDSDGGFRDEQNKENDL